jgi:Flp pilus assembly protein TadB
MEDWAKKLLRVCATLLLAMILLDRALAILRRLLPWLAGIALAAGIAWLAWWWIRRRRDRW